MVVFFVGSFSRFIVWCEHHVLCHPEWDLQTVRMTFSIINVTFTRESPLRLKGDPFRAEKPQAPSLLVGFGSARFSPSPKLRREPINQQKFLYQLLLRMTLEVVFAVIFRLIFVYLTAGVILSGVELLLRSPKRPMQKREVKHNSCADRSGISKRHEWTFQK